MFGIGNLEEGFNSILKSYSKGLDVESDNLQLLMKEFITNNTNNIEKIQQMISIIQSKQSLLTNQKLIQQFQIEIQKLQSFLNSKNNNNINNNNIFKDIKDPELVFSKFLKNKKNEKSTPNLTPFQKEIEQKIPKILQIQSKKINERIEMLSKNMSGVKFVENQFLLFGQSDFKLGTEKLSSLYCSEIPLLISNHPVATKLYKSNETLFLGDLLLFTAELRIIDLFIARLLLIFLEYLQSIQELEIERISKLWRDRLQNGLERMFGNSLTPEMLEKNFRLAMNLTNIENPITVFCGMIISEICEGWIGTFSTISATVFSATEDI